MDDLIQQRETLAGVTITFCQVLLLKLKQATAKRHNEQVASKIIAEATGNMEQKAKQENIFKDAIHQRRRWLRPTCKDSARLAETKPPQGLPSMRWAEKAGMTISSWKNAPRKLKT